MIVEMYGGERDGDVVALPDGSDSLRLPVMRPPQYVWLPDGWPVSPSMETYELPIFSLDGKRGIVRMLP